MNKKSNALSIIVWIVSVVVIVFFLAGYLYFHNALTTTILDAGKSLNTNIVNITDAAQKTIVPVNNAMNSLTWISFILIVCLAFGTLIENYYIREHPVLFFVHVMIVILGIIASIYISNFYEDFMNNSIFSSSLIQFTASSYVVLHLPYWVAVIGIFGLILLVINASRDPELRVGGRL